MAVQDFWYECEVTGSTNLDLTRTDSEEVPGGADDAAGPLCPWVEEKEIMQVFASCVAVLPTAAEGVDPGGIACEQSFADVFHVAAVGSLGGKPIPLVGESNEAFE